MVANARMHVRDHFVVRFENASVANRASRTTMGSFSAADESRLLSSATVCQPYPGAGLPMATSLRQK
jgi:hypothetical protein